MNKPYPYEDFVQKSVENYLIKNGYKILPKERRKVKARGQGVDIRAYKKTKTNNFSGSYDIECKGKTKNVYASSNEIFGQILKRMKKRVYPASVYVIAVPDIKGYRNELIKIPLNVYKVLSKGLNLKVWLVNEKGEIIKYKR